MEETRPEAAAKKAVERRQEVRVRHVVETPSPTIGGLLDTLFGMIGPAIKVVLKEALVEAITSPQVKEVLHEIRPAPPSPRHATQEEDAVAVAPAAASVPDGSPPRGVPAPKHKPVMPGELHEVERLPKVTVIGLAKPKQEWDIKEEFKNQFDIRTVHTDVSARVVRKYSAGSAHVLLVVDHINHNMQHGLLAGGIAFERIGGGVAKVRERLKELVAQYQPEAAHA